MRAEKQHIDLKRILLNISISVFEHRPEFTPVLKYGLMFCLILHQKSGEATASPRLMVRTALVIWDYQYLLLTL